MAVSHRFGKGGLDAALKVFPDLNWKASAAGDTWVYDDKAGKYEPVTEGDYIVRVGDRYEVTDEKPADADRATKATAEKIEAKLEKESDKDEPSALAE